jgi:hypothetical protein
MAPPETELVNILCSPSPRMDSRGRWGRHPSDDELLSAQLDAPHRLEQTERERSRMIDAYQAALIDRPSSPAAAPRSRPAASWPPNRWACASAMLSSPIKTA